MISPVVEQLDAALREVGDALAAADLNRLLATEERLHAARAALAAVTAPLDGGVRAELRDAIDGVFASLGRCRRLGAGLMTIARPAMDGSGDAIYSRVGRGAAALPAPSVEVRG